MICADCDQDSPSAFTMPCAKKVCRNCSRTHEEKCAECIEDEKGQRDDKDDDDEDDDEGE